MAEQLGRKGVLKMGSPAATVVAGVRAKTININNTVIDITTALSAGIRTMLAEPGAKSVSLSVDGLFDDSDMRLMDLALSGTNVIADFVLEFPEFTLTGKFALPTFTLGAPYNESQTFSATLESSGAIVKGIV